MKNQHVCPRCDGRKIGYVKEVDDQGQGDYTRRRLTRYSTGWFKAKELLIEVYVCTQCGYFEEYVEAPQEIDWNAMAEDDTVSFEWCEPRPT